MREVSIFAGMFRFFNLGQWFPTKGLIVCWSGLNCWPKFKFFTSRRFLTKLPFHSFLCLILFCAGFKKLFFKTFGLIWIKDDLVETKAHDFLIFLPQVEPQKLLPAPAIIRLLKSARYWTVSEVTFVRGYQEKV